MVDKISLLNKLDARCQEGLVISCLADKAGRTGCRGIVVEPRLPNLPKHKQYKKENK